LGFGNLSWGNIATLGNILAKLIIAIANISWERLFVFTTGRKSSESVSHRMIGMKQEHNT
jgi:hypothetical protein